MDPHTGAVDGGMAMLAGDGPVVRVACQAWDVGDRRTTAVGYATNGQHPGRDIDGVDRLEGTLAFGQRRSPTLPYPADAMAAEAAPLTTRLLADGSNGGGFQGLAPTG